MLSNPHTHSSLSMYLFFSADFTFSLACVCVCVCTCKTCNYPWQLQARKNSFGKESPLPWFSARFDRYCRPKEIQLQHGVCAREENPIKRWQNIYTRTKTPRNQKKTNEASTWIWWNTWTSGDVRTSKNLKWPHLTTIDREKSVISWFPGTWTEYSMTITVSNGGNYEALWVEALMFSSYIL